MGKDNCVELKAAVSFGEQRPTPLIFLEINFVELAKVIQEHFNERVFKDPVVVTVQSLGNLTTTTPNTWWWCVGLGRIELVTKALAEAKDKEEA